MQPLDAEEVQGKERRICSPRRASPVRMMEAEAANGYLFRQMYCANQHVPQRTGIGSTLWALLAMQLSQAAKQSEYLKPCAWFAMMQNHARNAIEGRFSVPSPD
jgi:hypothetical protein